MFICYLYRSAVSVDPFYEMLAARKKRISLKKKEEQPWIIFSILSPSSFVPLMSPPNTGHVFVSEPSLSVHFGTFLSSSQNASSSISLLTCLPDSGKTHSERRAHLLRLPLFLLVLAITYTTCHTTVRARCLSRLLSTFFCEMCVRP